MDAHMEGKGHPTSGTQIWNDTCGESRGDEGKNRSVSIHAGDLQAPHGNWSRRDKAAPAGTAVQQEGRAGVKREQEDRGQQDTNEGPDPTLFPTRAC